MRTFIIGMAVVATMAIANGCSSEKTTIRRESVTAVPAPPAVVERTTTIESQPAVVERRTTERRTTETLDVE